MLLFRDINTRLCHTTSLHSPQTKFNKSMRSCFALINCVYGEGVIHTPPQCDVCVFSSGCVSVCMKNPCVAWASSAPLCRLRTKGQQLNCHIWSVTGSALSYNNGVRFKLRWRQPSLRCGQPSDRAGLRTGSRHRGHGAKGP